MAYGARLESGLGASPREFESLSLRQKLYVPASMTAAAIPTPLACFEQGARFAIGTPAKKENDVLPEGHKAFFKDKILGGR